MNKNDHFGELRTILNTASTEFEVYDFDGKVHDDIVWLPLSYTPETRRGTYLMKMDPGAETTLHTHRWQEEYMIIEGDIVEEDGTVLGPGDHVIYKPGTRHCSRTVGGCYLIAFDWIEQ